ncbi:MAG: UDP-N-acetylmuramate dehydrogenase [Gaiellaceae bacterium]|jgi:UDP-N-acetylmuramate dehydrogenase
MKIEEGVELALFTTFGSGGPARGFVRARSEDAVLQALAWAAERNLPVLPLGFGSNLLVADEGVEMLALRLEGELASVEVAGEGLLVAGGGAADALCAHVARAAGLAGLEFAAAIPGTVGGGVCMNAGAWGSDFGAVLARALVVDSRGSRWLEPGALGLRYRGSELEPGKVVVRAEFRLTPSSAQEIERGVLANKAQRKSGQPVGIRSFGSVFKNPEHELGAGQMIDACGLKGKQIGGARISPEHGNFIENSGGATTADALALMSEARRLVHERFGVVLEPEVRLVGGISLPALSAGV